MYSTIILSEITATTSMTGVNRYLSLWVKTLAQFVENVVYLQFEYNERLMFIHEEKKEGICYVTVPMPSNMLRMVGSRSKFQEYLEVVYPQISHLFKGRTLLHLHSINLIELGLKVRLLNDCQILLHLHCIPWRGLYNNDLERFHRLNQIESKCKHLNPRDFTTIVNEEDAYFKSDFISCVTLTGQHFLQKLGVKKENTAVIYNGLKDICEAFFRDYHLPQIPKILFVGSSHQSKGLAFALSALEKVNRKGYEFEVLIAGNTNKQKDYRLKFPTLSLNFLGNLPYEELCDYYEGASIGVIASLQEQCSYVAIEMMMYGLPIVSTAVDGLGEMFTHDENALIVSLTENGTQVDVEQMSFCLIRLLNDYSLRKRLGKGARERYRQQFRLEQMQEQTLAIYKDLWESQK